MSIRETIVGNAMRELRESHPNGDLPSKQLFCQLNGIGRKHMDASTAQSMSATTLLRLCNAIGCTPNDLLRGLY